MRWSSLLACLGAIGVQAMALRMLMFDSLSQLRLLTRFSQTYCLEFYFASWCCRFFPGWLLDERFVWQGNLAFQQQPKLQGLPQRKGLWSQGYVNCVLIFSALLTSLQVTVSLMIPMLSTAPCLMATAAAPLCATLRLIRQPSSTFRLERT